ncbi:MAG: hypothetical protein WDZ40_02145 [Candidatus Spechtbacterales bacterium]
MAGISILQSQKKVKKFIPLIFGAVLLGGVVLLITTQASGEGAERFEGSEASSELLRRQIQNIKNEVILPEGFFGSDILGKFTPYEPIKAPAQWGRENPFSPFDPAEFVDQEIINVEPEAQEEEEILSE